MRHSVSVADQREHFVCAGADPEPEPIWKATQEQVQSGGGATLLTDGAPVGGASRPRRRRTQQHDTCK